MVAAQTTATINYSTVTPTLSTTFMPSATTCVQNQLTMLEDQAFFIWNNAPLPVPDTTFSDCYATQFMSSWLNSAGGVTQPAFTDLVCPQSYSQIQYTSNYIACCPSGYQLHPASVTPFSNRPAFGGTCFTSLTSGVGYRVTQYGNSSVTATTTWTAGASAQAYAYPYEGFAFGVAVLTSDSVALTTGTFASSSPSSTSSAAATTHTVIAGADPVFSPNTLNANVGDTMIFQFTGGNHSVTQSTFDTPCISIANGQDSGLKPNINGADTSTPLFSFLVSTTGSQWFYSEQAGECGQGMTFALNPTTSQSQALFQQAAISQNGTSSSNKSSSSSSSLSTEAKAAIGVVIPLAVIAILAAVFFFTRGRKARAAADNHELPPLTGASEGGAAEGYYGGRNYKSPGVYEDGPGRKDTMGGESEMHGESTPSEMPSSYMDPQELPDRHYSHGYGLSEMESLSVGSPKSGILK